MYESGFILLSAFSWDRFIIVFGLAPRWKLILYKLDPNTYVLENS